MENELKSLRSRLIKQENDLNDLKIALLNAHNELDIRNVRGHEIGQCESEIIRLCTAMEMKEHEVRETRLSVRELLRGQLTALQSMKSQFDKYDDEVLDYLDRSMNVRDRDDTDDDLRVMDEPLADVMGTWPYGHPGKLRQRTANTLYSPQPAKPSHSATHHLYTPPPRTTNVYSPVTQRLRYNDPQPRDDYADAIRHPMRLTPNKVDNWDGVRSIGSPKRTSTPSSQGSRTRYSASGYSGRDRSNDLHVWSSDMWNHPDAALLPQRTTQRNDPLSPNRSWNR